MFYRLASFRILSAIQLRILAYLLHVSQIAASTLAKSHVAALILLNLLQV
jgi:hypothetical protein